MKNYRLISNKTGFTIVELLIAMGVFSFVLLLVTVVIIGIGNLYSKGINLSRNQDTVRNIVNDIAQNIAYNSSPPITSSPASVNALCIGDIRYTYVTGKRIGDGTPPYKHVLWRDKLSSPGSCPTADLTLTEPSTSSNGGIVGSGVEMIPGNTQILTLTITNSSPYTINMTIAYGDPSNINASNQCKSSSNSQNCAVSSLTTSVVRRL